MSDGVDPPKPTGKRFSDCSAWRGREPHAERVVVCEFDAMCPYLARCCFAAATSFLNCEAVSAVGAL
jgi:hypothetical protein